MCAVSVWLVDLLLSDGDGWMDSLSDPAKSTMLITLCELLRLLSRLSMYWNSRNGYDFQNGVGSRRSFVMVFFRVFPVAFADIKDLQAVRKGKYLFSESPLSLRAPLPIMDDLNARLGLRVEQIVDFLIVNFDIAQLYGTMLGVEWIAVFVFDCMEDVPESARYHPRSLFHA